MKIRNPIIKRLIIIFVSVLFFGVVVYFAVRNIQNGYNNMYFDLGEKDSNNSFEDVILSTYQEYVELTEKLNIRKTIKPEDFDSSNYVASFQEYDSCSESKVKTINKTVINDGVLTITFDIHNKCGWCHKHIMVYFVEIPIKDTTDLKIEYNYNYDKQLNCGNL